MSYQLLIVSFPFAVTLRACDQYYSKEVNANQMIFKQKDRQSSSVKQKSIFRIVHIVPNTNQPQQTNILLYKWVIDYIFTIIFTKQMFVQSCLPLFDADLYSQDQSISQDKSEVNCKTWNLFAIDQLQFIDCDEQRDRKSTGLDIYDMLDQISQVKQQFSCNSPLETQSSAEPHKNQTKNIPKNYGKAAILYIKSNKVLVNKLLRKLELDEEQFEQYINQSRRRINTIKEIRNFWMNQKFGKAVRILSFEFIRKHSLKYIFNSRIKNYGTHVKYRNKLIEGLKNPQLFVNIKYF